MTDYRDKDKPDYKPVIREISEAREEARRISSELYDVIALPNGKVSQGGPGVALCGEEDPEKYYVIHHPWSLQDAPVADLKKAMERLRESLPKKGWKIISYGPDKSPSKSLELNAESTQRNFSVNIRLFDESKHTGPDAPNSMIYVFVASFCFQVPEGKTVDEY